ncbi:conserved Plasmodium protein, unknown function [Plasmodium vivax]|uniref:Uncharacterized protein n=1 Tax=Plasmodium vivax TaxID=5855 RepID=A0A1G4HG94_PLAVI|nr:conserved Plasmodium protein, unknown function [Plasmodium vivax]
MNPSAAVMFEENEKKKRKLFEDAPNYDANFLSNYVNEFSNNHVGFPGVGGNEVGGDHVRGDAIRGNEIRSNDICAGQVGAMCASHLGGTHLGVSCMGVPGMGVPGMGVPGMGVPCMGVNQNPFDAHAESRKNPPSPNGPNNCNSVHFNKNVLINSIDVLLNFINYSCLNESIKHEVLYDNLLNLRFHILSLNDEKFNQKKITEYFFKM